MNKVLTLALATACSALMLAEPLSSQPITVTPEVSHQAFIEKVSEDLDRQLERASRFNEPYGNGITIVRFTRDAQGDPENVRLYRKSGKHGLDRVAERAVKGLGSLDRVPAGATDDQVYQANIIFATTERNQARLTEQLIAEETARLARGKDRNVFAFGAATARPTS